MNSWLGWGGGGGDEKDCATVSSSLEYLFSVYLLLLKMKDKFIKKDETVDTEKTMSRGNRKEEQVCIIVRKQNSSLTYEPETTVQLANMHKCYFIEVYVCTPRIPRVKYVTLNSSSLLFYMFSLP